MNFLNALRRRQAMTIPNEGAPSAPQPDPALTGSLLDGGAPPAASVEAEGGDASAAPEQLAPLTRESLTLPEGFVDAVYETRGEGEAAVKVTAIDRALEIMNDTALAPAARTQQLVDLQLSLAQQAQQTAEAAWTDMQTQWRNDVKALPEIGGTALDQTLSVIFKGLTVAGADAAFFEAMTLTGAGNHPAVVKVLHALTKNLSEGKPVSGEPPKAPLSLADKLYPTMRA